MQNIDGFKTEVKLNIKTKDGDLSCLKEMLDNLKETMEGRAEITEVNIEVDIGKTDGRRRLDVEGGIR